MCIRDRLKKDNKSILKQVDAVMDMVKPSQPAGDNLSIKFNSGCKTEISSENKVDYLQLYYKKGEKIYQALGRASGEEVAGKTFIVPATEIYLYWKSNTSITDYGFAIDAINFTSSAATLTGTVPVSYTHLKSVFLLIRSVQHLKARLQQAQREQLLLQESE